MQFVRKDKLKTHVKSNKLISVEPTDPSAEVFEVRKKKNCITDKIPVSCAAQILSSAKLHFIEFVSDLADDLDCSAFRIIYMGRIKYFKNNLLIFFRLDTDSIFLAMSTDNIDELVKEETECWDLKKLYWFCETEQDKTPGYLLRFLFQNDNLFKILLKFNNE